MKPDKRELDKLFVDGLRAYHERNYFLAHEIWEDLWGYYFIEDRLFIQGLIQLAASLYKIQKDVLPGAVSLLAKAQNKFEEYDGMQRGIDMTTLKRELQDLEKIYQQLGDTKDFNFDKAPRLNIRNS